MKITISKYVAPQLYSSNFPGRDLTPDITGFLNLLCLQIEKYTKCSTNLETYEGKTELLNYFESKFFKIVEEMPLIFSSPDWEPYISYPSDKKTIEIGYEIIRDNEDGGSITLFNIHIEFLD